MGTVFAVISYFSYAASFLEENGNVVIDRNLALIALAVAPFIFVTVAFVSRNPEASKQVLRAMGLLLLLGLSVGLLSPVLGASAGIGVGTALSLRKPDYPGILGNRLWAILLAVAYTFLLLVVATPAGVLTGAALPMLIIGLADDFTVWRASRQT